MAAETETIPGFRNRIALLVGNDDPFAWAKKVGIPSSTFDRIWNSGTTPKAPHLIRIAEACGVSIDWLLTGKTEKASGSATPSLVPAPAWEVPGMKTADLAVAVASGDSMEPTIRDGDILLVDTGTTTIDGDAIYLLAGGASFLVKRVQHLLDGSVLVTSDNPAYAPETLAAADIAKLRCIGRVRWIGRAS